jgi:hypothetical protein
MIDSYVRDVPYEVFVKWTMKKEGDGIFNNGMEDDPLVVIR